MQRWMIGILGGRSLTVAARITAAVVLAASAILRAQSNRPSAEEQISRSLERITEALDAVVNHFADPVEPRNALYGGVLPGALSRLDPFSVFLDSEQYLQMQQQARGVRKGFGAVLSVQPGKITVLQSVPDSPFGRAGLGPGDRIVAVNGRRIAAMGLEEMVEVLDQARTGKVRLAGVQGGRV